VAVIYLIRHGRPVHSGVLLGSTDSPLAVEDLVPFRRPVDRVWTSPLRRAVQTAELLFPNRKIAIAPELAERALGEWDGLAWAEIETQWPELAARASADWFSFTPPGGEPWTEFMARVERAWRRIPTSSATAIVAHAGVNAVLHHLITARDVAGFQQDYGEVIEVVLPD